MNSRILRAVEVAAPTTALALLLLRREQILHNIKKRQLEAAHAKICQLEQEIIRRDACKHKPTRVQQFVSFITR